MRHLKRKEKWSLTLAFLVLCFILIALIAFHETWKLKRLEKATRYIPEYASPTLAQKILFQEDFDDPALINWVHEQRHGSTDYSVVYSEKGNSVLRAHSLDSASTLIKRIKYDPRRYPYLRWRWRVDKLGFDADMSTLNGSDAPARIYAAFPQGVGIWNTRLISYVWASSMPKGAVVHSFFSKNCKIVVLESGSEDLGKWIFEERNILEDYRNLFGEEPPYVEAIALMTDSDNTKGEAVAFYDEIAISSQP